MLVPNDLFFSMVEDALSERDSVVIKVRGNSMRPFLESDRDSVRLSRTNSSPKVGDAVLARLASGDFVLHRIIRKEGTQLTLQGDGLKNQHRESCDTSSVIATVTEYIRPNCILKADSVRMKLAVRLWMFCSPFRRVLLYAYRKIEHSSSSPDSAPLHS